MPAIPVSKVSGFVHTLTAARFAYSEFPFTQTDANDLSTRAYPEAQTAATVLGAVSGDHLEYLTPIGGHYWKWAVDKFGVVSLVEGHTTPQYTHASSATKDAALVDAQIKKGAQWTEYDDNKLTLTEFIAPNDGVAIPRFLYERYGAAQDAVSSVESQLYAPAYPNLSTHNRTTAPDGEVYVLATDSRLSGAPEVVADAAARDALTSGLSDAEKLAFHGEQRELASNSQTYGYDSVSDSWVQGAIVGNDDIDDFGSSSWDLFSLSIRNVKSVKNLFPDLADYSLSPTNGVQNHEAWVRCMAESDTGFTISSTGAIIIDGGNLELSSNKHFKGVGRPKLQLDNNTYMGWDGTGKSEPLTNFLLENIQLTSGVRAAPTPLFYINSDGGFNGVLNTNPPGKDCARFNIKDLRIIGAGKTGTGFVLKGVYTGSVSGLELRLLDIGMILDRGDRTSYGCNAIKISGEMQGANYSGWVRDFQTIDLSEMLIQGSGKGLDIRGPGRCMTLPKYWEYNGTYTQTDDDPPQAIPSHERYDVKIGEPTDTSAENMFNVVIAPDSAFSDGSASKDQAIVVHQCKGLEIGGHFGSYLGNPITNKSTGVDKVQGVAKNIYGPWDNPWHVNEFNAIDVETARFYHHEHNTGNDLESIGEISVLADIETELCSFSVPSIGFGARSEEVTITMYGALAVGGANKNLKIAINGVANASHNWSTTASGRSFKLVITLKGASNTQQIMCSDLSGFENTTPNTRLSTLSVNTLNTPLVVSVLGTSSSSSGITKKYMAWDKGH